MGVVWTASSDALAVSVRHPSARGGGAPSARVETSVSPTAEAMLWAARGGSFTRVVSDVDIRLDGFDETLRAVRFDYDEAGDAAAESSGFAALIRRAWALDPAVKDSQARARRMRARARARVLLAPVSRAAT